MERSLYLDAAKVFAIFSVVVIHVASEELYKTSLGSNAFIYANLLDSFARFCVPLFFMASGAVLLSKDYDAKSFYKKRAARILPALLVWSFVYLLFRVFAHGESIGILKGVLMVFGGQVYYHLWFLYVIAIAYLLTPFMRRLVVSISVFEARVLFAVWFVLAIAAPQIESASGIKFGFKYGELGVYCGYFMLGFYLSRLEFKKPLLALTAYILSSLAIFSLTYLFSLKNGALTVVFYDYATPLIFVQSVSLFLFFKNIDNQKTIKVLAPLSAITFGVYLLHPIVLESLDFISEPFAKSFAVFVLSALIVAALKKSFLTSVL